MISNEIVVDAAIREHFESILALLQWGEGGYECCCWGHRSGRYPQNASKRGHLDAGVYVCERLPPPYMFRLILLADMMEMLPAFLVGLPRPCLLRSVGFGKGAGVVVCKGLIPTATSTASSSYRVESTL